MSDGDQRRLLGVGEGRGEQVLNDRGVAVLRRVRLGVQDVADVSGERQRRQAEREPHAEDPARVTRNELAERREHQGSARQEGVDHLARTHVVVPSLACHEAIAQEDDAVGN